MVLTAIELRPMARRPLIYWSDTVHPNNICCGCGQNINYDEEIALVAVQEPLPADPSPDMLDRVEKFTLCSDCGTNVEKLVELGMKRIVDLEVEDPNEVYDPDFDVMQAFPGERKN